MSGQEAVMKLTVFLIVTSLFVCATNAQNRTKSDTKKFVPVAEQFYWTGVEGNLGIEIAGKFETEAALITSLTLETEIGPFKDSHYPFNVRKWTLRDILVRVDFGGGTSATWQVSGPKPLLMRYLEALKKGSDDKSVFYEFGYRFVNFKAAGD
jgi:hypothetical protein